MATHVAGIMADQSAANATAFPRIELAPTGRTIWVTEFGISMNAAPNSTVAPVSFRIFRSTSVSTGLTAGTPVKLNADVATALTTTGSVEIVTTGPNGTVTELHRLYVPVVSGVIWVAAPGREFDQVTGSFIGIMNNAALGASINAETYIVWEE